jgi:hypothetical protein
VPTDRKSPTANNCAEDCMRSNCSQLCEPTSRGTWKTQVCDSPATCQAGQTASTTSTALPSSHDSCDAARAARATHAQTQVADHASNTETNPGVPQQPHRKAARATKQADDAATDATHGSATPRFALAHRKDSGRQLPAKTGHQVHITCPFSTTRPRLQANSCRRYAKPQPHQCPCHYALVPC